ncbi:MAG: hypothetical protein KC547_02990 [Anaerolineae bacterium]|nr:hypothetical protein [Anaerolineae bacterium]MCA9907401.1 hypothetical protein [Anaerolineae bacterium]
MQQQPGGFKLNTRTIILILVALGILFLLFRNQGQSTQVTPTATPQPPAQVDNSSASSVQLGQLVTALSVDRDGCPGEVSTRFAPDDNIYVVARETDVTQGTAVFARLYHEGQSVEDTDEIVADSDMRVCINFVFENSQGFDTGNYEAEFFVNGNPAGSVAFTVR